jgi:ABC-type lipoprotein release transport system permease subunit
MFIMEAFIIGIIGTIVGLILGLLIHWPLSISGINFSIFSDALQAFGIGAVIYPVLSLSNMIILVIMIPFIAVIGALYPAYRAIRLEPIKAIYYV